jgi:hypothetical protein
MRRSSGHRGHYRAPHDGDCRGDQQASAGASEKSLNSGHGMSSSSLVDSVNCPLERLIPSPEAGHTPSASEPHPPRWQSA